MTNVAATQCVSYDRETVCAAVEDAFRLLGGVESIVAPGQRVLLKASVLRAAAPDLAVTTHPEVVRAVGRVIKAAGGVVRVGDSSGGVDYGKTDEALRACGIAEVAEEEGFGLVNFDTCGVTQLDAPDGRFLRRIKVSKAVTDADVIVSVAKLKTHIEVLYTGAVKNLLGCLPGAGKLIVHRTAPKPSDLSEALLDIYAAVRPQFSVVDGIVAMEGDGPNRGDPREVGAIVAGRDGVAVDAVASRIVGFRPGELPLLTRGEERGLGVADLDRINVLGAPISDLEAPDFKKPSNFVMRALPNALLKMLNRYFFTVDPVIETDRCEACGTCARACPAQAIEEIDERYGIDYAKCIRCMCCHELCPETAVGIKRSLLVRILSG